MDEGYIVGIDPDVGKNGVAVVDTADGKVTIGCADLPTLLDYVAVINHTAKAAGRKLTVFVEAGWVNQPNWHLDWRDSKQMAAAKGKALGRNQQRGMDIIEMLRYAGIDVREQAPLKKIWKGMGRKITHEELEGIMPVGKKRTNQEERDAALIAWVCAGFPVRVK